MKKTTIGFKIAQLRKKYNINQARLAEKSGLTAGAISMIESDDREPSISSLEKIADALKINIVDILGYSDNDLKYQSFYSRFGMLNNLSHANQELIIQIATKLNRKY